MHLSTRSSFAPDECNSSEGEGPPGPLTMCDTQCAGCVSLRTENARLQQAEQQASERIAMLEAENQHLHSLSQRCVMPIRASGWVPTDAAATTELGDEKPYAVVCVYGPITCWSTVRNVGYFPCRETQVWTHTLYMSNKVPPETQLMGSFVHDSSAYSRTSPNRPKLGTSSSRPHIMHHNNVAFLSQTGPASTRPASRRGHSCQS